MKDWLYIDCPCTSFPRSFARDYKETYLYPPPSTVYGCLLSLVGETDLQAHLGVKLAIGIGAEDIQVSRILRKQRHHKFSRAHQGVYPSPQFSKPNFQEVVTDLKVIVRLDSSAETSAVTLADRVAIALSTPERISRFGALSLGESWAMVNGIRSYRDTDGPVQWLIQDSRGLIALPIWIDRQTTRGTFQRFSLGDIGADFLPESWITILAPTMHQSVSKQSRKKYI